jgi:hypothetical protein
LGEFPGQFDLDEIFDMPEHKRYLLYALAVRVGQKKLEILINAENDGKIKSPYPELE